MAEAPSAAAKNGLATTTAIAVDPRPHFNGEIKLGDLLTTASLLAALIVGITGWVKDRNLRRREYADRVRGAAAKAAVALVRRQELAFRMYDAVQLPITEADEAAVSGISIVTVRDQLWKAIVSIRSTIQERLLDEKLEEAYVALYGYDTRIQDRYKTAMDALANADESAYDALLANFQEAMFEVARRQSTFKSADFGNPLRDVTARVRDGLRIEMQTTVGAFERSMAQLIGCSDRALFEGTFII